MRPYDLALVSPYLPAFEPFLGILERFPMAGFQVSTYGRLEVSTEATNREHPDI